MRSTEIEVIRTIAGVSVKRSQDQHGNSRHVRDIGRSQMD